MVDLGAAAESLKTSEDHDHSSFWHPVECVAGTSLDFIDSDLKQLGDRFSPPTAFVFSNL